MKLFIGIALAVLSAAYAEEINVCHGHAHNTFVRNVAQCNAWFRCTPNGPVPGTCPDPWLFNGNTQECDWSYNVQCFTCPITVPVVSMPVNGSCVQFIRCINGRPSQQACQNGLHFNPDSQQCDFPENVDCELTFTCPPNIPPGQMVSFRSATNCSEFYVCTGNPTPVQQACNPRLHFNPVTQQCTQPHLTDCELSDDNTTLNPDDPGTTQAPFTCTSDGHHPHPTSCSSFIVCAANTAHFFNCSDGLHYNASTTKCDFPAAANCFRN